MSLQTMFFLHFKGKWTSFKIFQWLGQTKIPIPNHSTEGGDAYGWIGAKLEEAEGESEPIGRPAVSINLDTREPPGTEPPTRQLTQADLRPSGTYATEVCPVWSQWEKCLVLETPGKGRPGAGEHPLRGKKEDWDKELCGKFGNIWNVNK